MKVTEQIDAMEVAAINPFKYLVVTRISDDTNGSSTCNICRWRWYAWRIYWYKYAWRRQSFRYISKVFDSLAFIDIIGDNQNVLLWFFLLE
jgi:phospholipid/cholesterol/gamma-HCH transport system permease protein